MCSRILPVFIFCVLQSSGVTPLKWARYTTWILLQTLWRIWEWKNFEIWSV